VTKGEKMQEVKKAIEGGKYADENASRVERLEQNKPDI
jgi:hypothetical protein